MTAEANPTPTPAHPLSRPRIEKFTMALGCALCIVAALWLSHLLRIPGTPGLAGTVLEQPNWPMALGLCWVVIIGGSVLACFIASRVHYDAGLFCASAGAAALAVRFGTMRAALHNASSPTVFLVMAIEVVALFAAVAAAWGVLRALMRAGFLPPEPIAFEDEPEEPLDQKLLASGAYIVLMILMMMLLSQSPAKAQALASVGIASYLAALGAHQLVPIRPSIWLVVAPVVVGVIGYMAQWMSPGAWIIADVGGFFAPLSRPIPLDYASLAPAGALLGYWTSHSWRRGSIEDELE
jgi:hypothetical protein